MMLRTNRVLLLLIIQFLFPISIFGQFKAISTERNTDLSFTSGVKVSLQGTEVFNEFKLVDELGYEYNVMSVLKNDKVREELSITDEQYDAMKAIQQKMTEELLPQTVAGISSKDIGKKLEAQVKATELILEGNLDAHQRTRLSQIKNQIRFDQFGAAAIAASDYLEKELNMPAELAGKVREEVNKLKSEHTRKIKKLRLDANQQVVASMPAKNKNKFKNVASEEFRDKFLSQPLFKTKPKRRFRRIPSDVSFLRLLSDPSIRESIELVDSQYDEIIEMKKEFDKTLEEQTEELLSGAGKNLTISQRGKQLAKLNSQNKKNFEKKLRESLLEHQLERLIEISIEIETKNAGTVQCMCNGTISERIELDEDDAKKVYLKAVEIQKKMQAEIDQLEAKLNEQAMKLIPNFDTAKRMGPPVEFKLR